MSTIAGSTMPLEIVADTAVPNVKAAMKLKNAAQATASVGVNTRVDTIVAIELAASWKPLRKSKTSARKMMKITSAKRRPVALGIGALAGAAGFAAAFD